jgi:hypothetical protein
MKKILFVSLVVMSSTLTTAAQEFGLSFSYFIPRNGYFSTPISPFSIRGIGVNLNKFIALETGASLYRMSGLNIIDLPFESKDALLGPNFTLFIPAELVIQLHGENVEFDIKGGGFFFYGFDNKINYGNFDKAIRQHEAWTVANSTMTYDNNPGFGYHVGAEVTFYVTRQFGISLESNYLMGGAKFPLSGSYSGGTTSIETVPFQYSDARVDFTGLEFSIGIIFTGK